MTPQKKATFKKSGLFSVKLTYKIEPSQKIPSSVNKFHCLSAKSWPKTFCCCPLNNAKTIFYRKTCFAWKQSRRQKYYRSKYKQTQFALHCQTELRMLNMDVPENVFTCIKTKSVNNIQRLKWIKDLTCPYCRIYDNIFICKGFGTI